MVSAESLSDLVERASRAERAAEETLCQRFAPAVRAFARRRLRGAEAVDEFTQDVLLLTIEALRGGRVEEPERLGGFVLGICRTLAFDRARQRERRQQLWETYGAALEVVSVEAAHRETYEVIHLEDCLSQLSRRARELIRLGYLESRGHDEVARALDISESNARVLRHRTLASLRECMSKRMSWEAA
jgi:RNA polymerase sigma-70 factor (ECF subfamily)